ncbi:Hsp70 family protein [Streptomyces sp. SID5785]|uniref:Hsp70 family protein n=1 Tax=Streptomyces sp. SID5785 TaxID=2690309 RepID=UPI0013614A63|nr:Hsp70 family protein [Streptomyces sp. SID5785]MZD05943.1 Hsp70 family protein [Streptomyces sp. SID5785]
MTEQKMASDQQIVSKAVGIDLGTTNSAVAVMNPADSEILIHRDPVTKSSTTPSCVWRSPSGGEPVVGRKAFARKGSSPEPVTSVKRLMGTRTTVDLSGEAQTPQQISAAILGEMKRQIEEDVAAFDTDGVRWVVDRAVVTVPAYFDQPQIDATREAAEQAGLEVLGLLHEPTAAASHYCWRTATQNGTFLVYDLGGGTFDVSVLRCTAGTFEVLGISGNNRLGGDDIDAAVARHLQKMLQADGYDLDLDTENDPEDALRFSQLKILAEGAKKALSERTEYVLRDAGRLTDQSGEPVIVETLLERDELDAVARPFVERTFTYCDEAVARATERAGITLADVDHIILAGGSTHMPLVREMVTRELCAGADPDSPRQVRASCAAPVYEQVDTVVALGAAVRASAVGGLAVHDRDRTVRVSFHGTAATGRATTSVGGTVKALTDSLDLTDGQVRLTTDGFEDQVDLSPEGAFAFRDVPVQPDAESSLTFEVYDAYGDLLATAGRQLAHSSGEQRPTGGTGGAAITAKAVLMEVDYGDGRTGREELVPAMQQLPYERGFEFAHPGRERVELRLFQQSVPIQVITVLVPSSTPRGTAIRLTVSMFENAAISVRGSIGEVSFDVPVELPVERTMPSEAETESLGRRFEESIGYLPAGPQNTAKAQWAMAQQAFRQAKERGDVAGAVHEFRELEQVAGSVSGYGGELQPPKAEFDELVGDCMGLHAHLVEHGVPEGKTFDGPDIARGIEGQRTRGEQAYAAGDQQAYGEVIRQLQRVSTYLKGLMRVERGTEIPPAARAAAQLRADLKGTEELLRVADATGRAVESRELAEIQHRLRSQEALIATDPEGVLRDLSRLNARLRQLARMLVDADTGPAGPAVPIYQGGPGATGPGPGGYGVPGQGGTV